MGKEISQVPTQPGGDDEAPRRSTVIAGASFEGTESVDNATVDNLANHLEGLDISDAQADGFRVQKVAANRRLTQDERRQLKGSEIVQSHP